MPTRTQASEKDKKVQEVTTSPNDPNSVTPIPQARSYKEITICGYREKGYCIKDNKRALQQSLCLTGKDANDPSEEPIIIDDATWYINLKDFADSVRSGGLLSNSTCQMALNTIYVEMAKQKKFLMPLRIAAIL